MSRINVIDRDGKKHQLKLEAGTSLMEALRDQNFGVDGTCGGAACCGSCHIFIEESWLQKLPADEIEAMTIEGLVHAEANSRLSCQIDLNQDLEGLKISIAPPEI